MIPGGWTIFKTEISEKEREVFNKAFENFVGVTYTPIAVATQVVAGMNYKFFCNSQVVYPDAPNKAAMVTIFEPLNGPVHITEIEAI